MKPIIYLVCNLIILAYGIYAASVHGNTLAWLIVLVSIVFGLGMSAWFGASYGKANRISWRRTALHGRIRPAGHRHY